ncbi:MAG TPA: LysE family translocator [Gaiellaceae bacterium]|jgi:threonine/homoserine/homoserine lactone efflux protein
MPTGSTIALFALASFALAVVPGPAVTYIVTQSIDKGRRAGLTSALGVSSGGLVHVAAATLGLSALIASSATAFTAVKFVGAAYLIAIGIKRIVTKDETVTETQPAPLRRVWRQGLVVNVFNPKTALFFVAFLPQFVDPHRGAIAPQVAFLGVLFVLIALSSDATYALLASTFASRLRGSERAAKLKRYFTGSIFVVLGATAAAAHRN